jgi:hypothetical protein
MSDNSTSNSKSEDHSIIKAGMAIIMVEIVEVIVDMVGMEMLNLPLHSLL